MFNQNKVVILRILVENQNNSRFIQNAMKIENPFYVFL